MKGWSHNADDLRDTFPIENLPLEILGAKGSDALSLLYKKQKQPIANQPGRRFSIRNAGFDKEKIAFFRKILPILDGFNSIFKYAQSQNIVEDEILSNWLNTLEKLYLRLLSALEKEGLAAIESVGKPLDLSNQEVVDVREVNDAPDNIILEEMVKGYTYGARVLRDAKVIVAKNPGYVPEAQLPAHTPEEAMEDEFSDGVEETVGEIDRD